MTDGFGRHLSAGAVAGPVVAALLAGSAAYAVQQDSFASTVGTDPATAAQPPKEDQALVALQKAVKKQQLRLEKMRADLRHTQRAVKHTNQKAKAAARSAAQSTWVPSSSGSSGWTSSGSTSGGGSSTGGGSSSSGSSSGGGGGSGGGGATATTTQPSTQGTTGASGAP
jgi:predicted Zn-dependent protease